MLQGGCGDIRLDLGKRSTLANGPLVAEPRGNHNKRLLSVCYVPGAGPSVGNTTRVLQDGIHIPALPARLGEIRPGRRSPLG